MREKYLLRGIDSQCGEFVLGIRYDPPDVNNLWRGAVIVGGAIKFEKVMVRVCQAFVKGQHPMPHGGTGNKTRIFVRCAPELWQPGLDVLRVGGITMEPVERFRRLMS